MSESELADAVGSDSSVLAALVFDQLAIAAAVLDQYGTIAATNQRWQVFSHLNDGAAGQTGVGVNYLDVCDRSGNGGDPTGARAAAGIRQILQGDRDHFELEYRCPSVSGDAWFELQASRGADDPLRVVVLHVNITAQKRLDALGVPRRSRREAPSPRRSRWSRWTRGSGRRLGPGGDANASTPALPMALASDRESVMDALGEGVLVQDVVGRVVYANLRARDLLAASSGRDGVTVVDETGDPLPDGRMPGRRALRDAIAVENEVLGLRDADGQVRWLEVSSHPMTSQDGGIPYAVVSVLRDVTDRRQATDLLAVKARLLDSVGQAVVAWDTTGHVTFANSMAEELYGFDRDAVIGQPVAEVVDIDEDRYEGLVESVASGLPWEGELRIGRGSRTPIPVWTTNTPIYEDGIIIGHIGVSKDISERKAAEARLAHRFRHDVLTDLPTRRTFVELLAERISFLDRPGLDAVLLVDIGSMDLVNDAFAHATGDAVVLHCAELLRARIHPGDALARFSDRAFAVCCSHADDSGAAHDYADELRAALSEPFEVDGVDLHLPVSASVVAMGAGECGADELIRRADTALLRARRDRSTRMYDASMQAEIMRQVHMTDLVHQILAAGVVGIGYQPIVRLTDQTIVGAEALLRATDDGEPVSPVELVEAAERSGRIAELGELILRTACADAAAWPRSSSGLPVGISVNLSARQLDDPSLPRRVTSALEASGLPPTSLCLEVTEGALMADPARAAAQLGSLRVSGIRFAADDFGTGYSSLAYLKALPLDALKIDQSFVAGLPESMEDVAITQAVLAMSDALGLSVTAEGVETERQLGALLELGTGFGQGYLWGKAMSTEEFAARIQADAVDAAAAHVVPVAAPWRIPTPAALGSSEERIDSILSIIAHEIRTPLTVVVGYAHILQDTEEVAKAEAAAAIERAAMRIERILANIVGLSVEGGGLRSGERHIIDVQSAVQEILDDQLPRTAALLVPATERATPILVAIDAGQFAQVVTNLISNAAKFSPPGSPIEVTVTEVGGWVDVGVTDRGPGVAADDLGLIFRKYGRTDPLGNGTGLGLYLARQIARGHGGDILYRRADGAGSVFVLRLPEHDGLPGAAVLSSDAVPGQVGTGG